MRELVIGAGNEHKPKIRPADGSDEYADPTFLDIDPSCKPDVLWDLNDRPLPFDDECFDSIHAYEVLEHIGAQGDWRGFFAEWEEYARIMKPGGMFFASCPSLDSRWLWGDPGHTRAISTETLTFLSQAEYEKQVGDSSMTDYRNIYHADFELVYSSDDGQTFSFVLRKRDSNA